MSAFTLLSVNHIKGGVGKTFLNPACVFEGPVRGNGGWTDGKPGNEDIFARSDEVALQQDAAQEKGLQPGGNPRHSGGAYHRGGQL